MCRKVLICLCLLLVPISTALAEVKESASKESASKESEAKELSGMSILGNDEAPKALYIVPWKSSEMGMETSLSMMLNDSAIPVDRDVFKRQLDFYELSAKK